MLEIKKLQGLKNISLTDAEKIVLDNTTHCDIGAWFAEKWNLPDQLCDAIRFHHSTFYDVAAIKEQEKSGKPMKNNGAGIEQPLTVIVAISEWFAAEMGFMKWVNNEVQPTLYLANEVLDELKEDDYLHPDSALEVFKSEIADEFEKASVFHELPGWAMY